MKTNLYELLYMIRMKSAEALEELFLFYKKGMDYEIASLSAKNQIVASFKDDLLIEAQIALVRAVDHYRFDQKCTFNSFAQLIVRRRIGQAAKRFVLGAFENGLMTYSLDYEYEADENQSYTNLLRAKDLLGDPVYRLHYNEAARRVKRAVSSLNDTERKVLDAWIEGGTYAMCSEKIGITVRQYERRLNTVKRKMIVAARDEPVSKTVQKRSAAGL